MEVERAEAARWRQMAAEKEEGERALRAERASVLQAACASMHTCV